jgi:aspartyl-tRNA(Asn)/glutamyl-tRNA(Gln) amidotransferase subunit A
MIARLMLSAACLPSSTAAGLPVGLQIVGRRLDDATVLRAAYAFEEARPWSQLWPPLVALGG